MPETPSIPTLEQVRDASERERLAQMLPDPVEQIQREIDRHNANAWVFRRPGDRLAHERRGAELQAQLAALLSE
jgi:hypothetical protein